MRGRMFADRLVTQRVDLRAIETMIFSNPPLVELVAELRWLPGMVDSEALQSGAQSAVLRFPLSAPSEESFARFSAAVGTKGFTMSERLVPVGFPSLPYNVVYRFRKPPREGENYLYQIGAGVFSANALPPYRDWDSFRPIVREGVEALLTSRPKSEDREFTHVILRYIDLFSPEFTEDKSSFQFLNEILGIRVQLPPALAEQAAHASRIQSGLQLSLPLKNELSMNLTLQEGTAAGKSGIVMTTEVLGLKPTSPQADRVMEMLERAHTSIRATFLGLTERLRDKMKPVQ